MASTRVTYDAHEVVLVTEDGKAHRLPPEAAFAIARALNEAGKLADEFRNRAGLARDQALVIRRGLPFGLTNNPRILAEAKKLAEGDRELRKIPMAVPYRGAVGTPEVLKGTNDGNET